MKIDLSKLGIRKNLEIFSSTDEDLNIKVKHFDLLKKEDIYNEMLEGLIFSTKVIADLPIEDDDFEMMNLYRWNVQAIEKATGKTWNEVRELLK